MLSINQVGYFTLIPSLLLVFAIFTAINGWRRIANWCCLGGALASLAMVIPSLGIIAHLTGAFAFGEQDSDQYWVYGLPVEPIAAKSIILWAGGWIPILGLFLFLASIGSFLWIEEPYSKTVKKKVVSPRVSLRKWLFHFGK